MQIACQCPSCERIIRSDITETPCVIRCAICDWSRDVREADLVDGKPDRCLLCGCGDLWRQKDFPPRLGLTIAGIGALSSTITFYFYRPIAAITILMGFALLDMLLYWRMKDVLVCYRCGCRHRRANLDDDHATFNLELAERYRQESLRLEQ